MSVTRRDHNAVLLDDGTVLIVSYFTTAAELYDPSTGEFSIIGQTAYMHGQGASATRLLDGSVLIVGGNGAIKSAELYDPKERTFTPISDCSSFREHHTATLLKDGTVLLAAGQAWGPQSHTEAELYDPSTQSFSPTGSLNDDRGGHTATLLADGRVLVLGGTQTTDPGYGICLKSAEVYDPTSGIFTIVDEMAAERCSLWWVGAPLLSSGKVLVTGGAHTSVAELFDPTTETFTPTGDLIIRRGSHTASLLADGTVLLAGGFNLDGGTFNHPLEAEVFDPLTESFTLAAPLNQGRSQHTATVLFDGRVLVVGGWSIEQFSDLATAELYNGPPPYLVVTIDVKPSSDMNTLNLGSNGTVTVAILGSAGFDVATVHVSTVLLEGADVRLRGNGSAQADLGDVNDDGFPDLILHFHMQSLSIVEGQSELTLTGYTYDGVMILGTDYVTIVPS